MELKPMATKITVTEETSSFGQQVFVFGLPSGRTLKLEFCAALIEPGGDACCAAATLFERDGKRVPLEVNDSGKETQTMSLVSLWFSTSEEDEWHDRTLTQELDAIKEDLAPLIDAIKKNDSHKNN